MKFKKFNYKTFFDKRGLVSPVHLKKKLKLNIKRLFFVSGKKNSIRGNHAHKKCIQCFIQVKGKSKIELSSKNNIKNFYLIDKKKIALIVYPKTWVKMKFFSNNNLTLVLCYHEYDKKEYIRDYQKL